MTQTFLIKKPLVTEKVTDLNAIGKYVFVVDEGATKNEIKKAVKELYRVDVVKVNVINRHAKTKKFRAIRGKRGGFKKAIVTLKAGQTITLQ